MIIETKTYTCSKCGSENIISNGSNRYKNPQYLCKDCGASRVLTPTKLGPTDEEQQAIIKTYAERSSLRGLTRVFKYSRVTITKVLKKHLDNLPPIEDTLNLSEDQSKDESGAHDILELDEICSFVEKKTNKVWTWTALCKATRKIVACVTGDRSVATCTKLYDSIPERYKKAHTFSDFWQAYQAVFPKETHTSVGKETGLTNHMERWNNTLRQRIGRMTRKTLSFSKKLWWHEKVIYWFVILYNSSIMYN
jgi:IS1 family transposase/transposase-like protein